MKLIETLFDYLVLKSIHVKKGHWADKYFATLQDMQKLKKKLIDDPALGLRSPELYGNYKQFSNYSELMEFCFVEEDNGISSKGQSNPSHVKLRALFDENDFNDTCCQLIKFYDDENLDKLSKIWKPAIGQNNWLLYHRLLSAADADLTCVVDESKFNTAVNHFSTEMGYQNHGVSWHARNKHLTKWLYEELKEQLNEERNQVLKKTKEFPSEEDRKQAANTWVKVLRNIFVWQVYELNLDMFDLKKNIVKYGAPGTGKTYTCKTDTKKHFDFWKSVNCPKYQGIFSGQTETVQFHPSFSYEDFMEGIRPVPDANGNTQLRLTNGIFKKFCKKAAQWEMEIYPLFKERDWSTEPFEKIRVKEIQSQLTSPKWEYLRGIEDNDKQNPKLLQDYLPPFYFIIDEINRAELSRVMGELMLCLEYRGISGKIKTQYSYLSSETEETQYWVDEHQDNYFFVPHNVYILATMNTIDRSVESFDFALRRRFRWIEVPPNYEVLTNYLREKKQEETKLWNIVNGLK